MKPEFSRKIFEKKYLNIKFRENSPGGPELFNADRRTDRQIGMAKLIVELLFAILRTRLKKL